jgi:2-iminobutanoate/2-iminopropanoate deaminase
MTRTAVGGTRPAGAYSPGIAAEGRLLVVSGQGPFIDGQRVDGSIEEETLATLRNVFAVVEAAGGTEANIVRCGVFLADIADFDGMDRAYRSMFSEPLPARTTVGCALVGIRVEIDCIAVI